MGTKNIPDFSAVWLKASCPSVAAAAYDMESDDKEPDPVVIKKSAKAVCHDKILRELGIYDWEFAFSLSYYVEIGEMWEEGVDFLLHAKFNF